MHINDAHICALSEVGMTCLDDIILVMINRYPSTLVLESGVHCTPDKSVLRRTVCMTYFVLVFIIRHAFMRAA